MALKINLTPWKFYAYTTQAGGYLPNVPEAHALFHYYLTARSNQENEQGKGTLILEGELDPIYNYQNLWRSIANLHGVDPNMMAKFWLYVDKQCDALQLPRLEGKVRFDGQEGGKILPRSNTIILPN